MGSFLKIVLLLWSCVLEAALSGAEPIRVTRETMQSCRDECCVPRQSTLGPIVDFVPEYDSSRPIRVRKALQCMDATELEAYAEKLYRGYELMQALPDDDPRSLQHQSRFHCTILNGSMFQDGTNPRVPFLVICNWLSLPWHRWFIYFHERMLQSLLGDPDFTLHFWNFDNSGMVSASGAGCSRAGHHVPPLYTDPSKFTFHDRLNHTFDPSAIVDLLTVRQPVEIRPDKLTIAGNRYVMHSTRGQAATEFLGRKYKRGDYMTRFMCPDAAGSLDSLHLCVHNWIGLDMVSFLNAALDPLFYTFHFGVDRLYEVWAGSGMPSPVEDPDWMEVEFLFFDENKQMRRVKIKDSLSTEALGYTYEKVNDDNWLDYQLELDDTLNDEEKKQVAGMDMRDW